MLDSHCKEFRNVYDTRFSKRYGCWRALTDEVVEKYLKCGDPQYGFARIRCEECGAEYLEHFHPTPAWNLDVSDPLEWIARITSHIPRKGAKQVIYYGAYSQAWRGRERRRRAFVIVL